MITLPRCLLLATLVFQPLSPATAATVISSSAFGLSSTVKVINTVGVTVGPIGAVSGTTPPGYANIGGVASANATVDLGVVSLVSAGLQLGTGVIATSASANGTTPADTSAGSASADVDDLNLRLFTSVLGVSTTTLGLTADVLRSQTQVVRIGQSATLLGQSSFSNLSLSLFGLPLLALGADAQVAPNFVVYDLAGLRILLNEQVASTDSNGVQRLLTNAMRISFDNFLLSGRALTGDVIISQSVASIGIDAVPEPAAWTQLIAGFGVLGLALRRRRTANRQPARH